MVYTYPSTVFINYVNKNPNLSVRCFLIRKLQKNDSRPIDPTNTNVYIGSNIFADRVDGKLSASTEPLIMARQDALELEFRTNHYYTFSVAVEDLEPGQYVAVIEAHEPDALVQGTYGADRVPGNLVEYKKEEFLIEYSPIDRVVCVGYDSDRNPIHKSLADIIQTIYVHTVSDNALPIGVSRKDLLIELPNIKDGEVVTLTYKESDIQYIGKQYQATVVSNTIRLIGAPEGKYLLRFKNSGDSIVVDHC